MRRFGILIAISIMFLSLTGCSSTGKPGDIVKEYLKKASVYDIAGLKSLCTGEAWKTLDDLAADIDVDKVLVDDPAKAPEEGQTYWSEVESRYQVTLQKKTSNSATVLVASDKEQVTFQLVVEEGKWMISSISNPEFGLTPLR